LPWAEGSNGSTRQENTLPLEPFKIGDFNGLHIFGLIWRCLWIALFDDVHGLLWEKLLPMNYFFEILTAIGQSNPPQNTSVDIFFYSYSR
jgi:hypothetical protein